MSNTTETDDVQHGRSIVSTEELLRAADVHPSASIEDIDIDERGVVIDWYKARE